ncbi:hypothetical protein BKG89_05500 [Rodentibacter caecimuris]|uniref:Uncharacterized protein n=2 Tax=Rodentibacter caecimuris TaxID=1796644 RepID=A0ABX3L0I0_9PAST|nr:hypothetical protein BKG89_05500 [Rodentibacter heylii]
MLYLGQWIAQQLPFGIPGSIWGLLLLFFCLVKRIIPLEWIYFGASLLIRFMAVLFVPISVGIIEYADLMLSKMEVLLIPNILSTILGLICIALFADRLFTKDAFSRKRKKANNNSLN